MKKATRICFAATLDFMHSGGGTQILHGRSKMYVAMLRIDDDVARMLQVLITLVKPKKNLEIGTSVGFSTVSMAKSVRNYGSQITTIEFDAKVAEQALQNFEREMVAEQIEIRIGDAREIIPTLTEGYDLIFSCIRDCLMNVLGCSTLVDCWWPRIHFFRLYCFLFLNGEK